MDILGTLSTIGIFLLGLSLLIVIHELGHYWAARIFGIKVEEFALFFGKKIIGWKRGETEWRINMIPLGGYVKIAGMLDEHLDKEQVSGEPEPWEFRAKPTWQKLIVMLGGIIMNIILGVLIFVMMKTIYGDYRIPMERLENGIIVMEDTPGYEMGFRTGDIPVLYKGDSIEFFEDLKVPEYITDRDKEWTVLRDGKPVKVAVADDFLNNYSDYPQEKQVIALPDAPPVLVLSTPKIDSMARAETGDSIRLDAYNAGLRPMDLVVEVDSTPVAWFSEFRSYIKSRPAGTSFDITVKRDGELKMVTIVSDTNQSIGVGYYEDTLVKHITYSFGEAIPVGTKAAFGVISSTLSGLYAMVTGNADPRKSLSGPVKIAQIYGQATKKGGWAGFWRLTGFLSMVLAIMNLLPIPVLDGGQVLILSIEAIIGREIPIKIKEWILTISFYLVIALMLLVVLNDII